MLVNTLSLVKYCNEIELVDNKVYNFSDKNTSVPPISYVMTSFVSKYPCIHDTASYIVMFGYSVLFSIHGTFRVIVKVT